MSPRRLSFDKPIVKKVSAAIVDRGDKVPFGGSIGAELMMGAVMLDKLSHIVSKDLSVTSLPFGFFR